MQLHGERWAGDSFGWGQGMLLPPPGIQAHMCSGWDKALQEPKSPVASSHALGHALSIQTNT